MPLIGDTSVGSCFRENRQPWLVLHSLHRRFTVSAYPAATLRLYIRRGLRRQTLVSRCSAWSARLTCSRRSANAQGEISITHLALPHRAERLHIAPAPRDSRRSRRGPPEPRDFALCGSARSSPSSAKARRATRRCASRHSPYPRRPRTSSTRRGSSSSSRAPTPSSIRRAGGTPGRFGGGIWTAPSGEICEKNERRALDNDGATNTEFAKITASQADGPKRIVLWRPVPVPRAPGHREARPVDTAGARALPQRRDIRLTLTGSPTIRWMVP